MWFYIFYDKFRRRHQDTQSGFNRRQVRFGCHRPWLRRRSTMLSLFLTLHRRRWWCESSVLSTYPFSPSSLASHRHTNICCLCKQKVKSLSRITTPFAPPPNSSIAFIITKLCVYIYIYTTCVATGIVCGCHRYSPYFPRSSTPHTHTHKHIHCAAYAPNDCLASCVCVERAKVGACGACAFLYRLVCWKRFRMRSIFGTFQRNTILRPTSSSMSMGFYEWSLSTGDDSGGWLVCSNGLVASCQDCCCLSIALHLDERIIFYVCSDRRYGNFDMHADKCTGECVCLCERGLNHLLVAVRTPVCCLPAHPICIIDIILYGARKYRARESSALETEGNMHGCSGTLWFGGRWLNGIELQRFRYSISISNFILSTF